MKAGARLSAAPIWALIFLILTTSGLLRADVTGSILGTVHDPTGAVVAGATVKVTNTGTNQSRASVTDETGSYRVLALPVGHYTVEVTQPGFQRFLPRRSISRSTSSGAWT